VPLAAGHTLAASELTVKKPGNGIPATELPRLIGRVVRRDLPGNAFLAESDLEPVGVEVR
jgi:sialic acid synthase SpsE